MILYVNDLSVLQERYPDRAYSITWSEEFQAYEIDMEEMVYATNN